MNRVPMSRLKCLPVLLCLAVLMLSQAALAQSAEKPAGAAADGAVPAEVGLAQLADIIENEETRAQLLKTLRQAAQGDDLEQAPAAASEALPAPADASAAEVKQAVVEQAEAQADQVPIMRRLAQTTSAWAEVISTRVVATWNMLLALGPDHEEAAIAAGPRFDSTAFWNAAITFLLVVLSTVVAFFVLRLLAGALFSSADRLSQHGGNGFAFFVRRAAAAIAALLIDAAVVLLACAVGYAAGLFLFGEQGEIGTRETLFINAFALIELTKVGIHAVFSSKYEHLRLIAMPNSVAGWWSIRLRWFVGVIGYSLLVAVPIINAQLSPFVGAVISFLIMAGAYGYALLVIFGNRKLLTRRLLDEADSVSVGLFAVLLRMLAWLWVFLALAYFTTLFVASQFDRAGALAFMLGATLQTLIAAAIALGLSGLLSKAIGKRIPVSENTRQRLPMLEHHVNAYVPTGLKVARIIILVAFAMVLADAWRLFDLEEWLASEIGLKVVSMLWHLIVVFAGALFIWVVLVSYLEHRLGMSGDGGPPSARQETLMTLIRNALGIFMITMTAMVALSQIGVDIGPLIAGAGVLGLAIGFGAQALVSDVITGLFIQLQNAMSTGDVVTLAGVTGTAEHLTIRSVSIRDLDGTLHIVPFSSATVVSNYMREFAYHRHEYRIAYREDIDEAIQTLRAAFEDLKNDPDVRPNLLEDILIPGVTSLSDDSVDIRIMIKTLPGAQWSVGRAYNRLVKMHFDAAGIEIPRPHRTLYFGRDKEGWSPAARLRIVDTSKTPLQKDKDTSEALDTSGHRDDKPGPDTGDAPH